MNKEYRYYTVKDLLRNDSFLCWKLFSSESDRMVWEETLVANTEIQKEIDKATKILESVKLNDYKLSPEEKDDMLNLIKERISHQKKKKRRYTLWGITGTAVAASVALLISFSVFDFGRKDDVGISMEQLSEDAENNTDILLVLADEVMTLKQNADIQYKSDGNIIIANSTDKETVKSIERKQVEFNKLIVPNGKRSFLTLEDGTKIWVNSGSTLEFPNAFLNDQREIRIEGEIYIEVAKDKGRPFFVNTSDLKVEVLGTRFNVSAYKNEEIHSVVLVEGKVVVDASKKKIELKPDQMLTISNENVRTERVNVYNYISWKDGLLQYSGESLAIILNKLSRYYNIPVIYDENIQRMKCDGKLVLFDNIQDIMETIYNTNPIEYTIEEKCIRVKERRK